MFQATGNRLWILLKVVLFEPASEHTEQKITKDIDSLDSREEKGRHTQSRLKHSWLIKSARCTKVALVFISQFSCVSSIAKTLHVENSNTKA
jgi:hypothetical protein